MTKTKSNLERIKNSNSDIHLSNSCIKKQSESEIEEITSLKSCVLMDHDYCHTSFKSQIAENNKTIVHLPNGLVESNLQNGPFPVIENEKSTLLNGLPNNSNEDTSLNTNKINVQKLATTLKDTPTKMQPLNISIPEAFKPQNRKQFLVLKNKDVVPVNIDPKSKILIDPATIKKKVNDCSVNEVQGGGCFKSEIKKAVHKNSEKSKLLKINPSNSLLLTANYSEPALKIVDSIVPQNLGGIPNSFKSDTEFKNKSKVGKMKVILGRDKGKTSKKEIYEEVMK